MENIKPNWISNTEGIKNILESVAIIIAGIWALFTFVLTDSPSLYRTNTGDAKIEIDSLDQTHINVDFTVLLKNPGKQSFELDSTIVEYWILPIDSIKSKIYFNVNDYTNVEMPTGSYRDSTLSGLYAIDEEYSQDYNFIVRNDYTKMIILRVNYFMKINRVFYKESINTSYYNYRLHCIPDK